LISVKARCDALWSCSSKPRAAKAEDYTEGCDECSIQSYRDDCGAAGADGRFGAGGTGRAEEGKAIAQRWCAACHQVSPEQTTASADVGSFMTVAEMRATTSDLAALEGFLADSHPVMPDMSLTRQEIRDLVAYIGSLK
jgi:mono/diheme cytochrome c family protein